MAPENSGPIGIFMRIVFDATALHGTNGKRGGIENALWETFSHLRAIDGRHFYLACIAADTPVDWPDDERWQWHRLPFEGAQKKRRILWQQLELPLLLRRTGADLLHSWNYVMPLVSRVPTILTVQDTIALDHPRFALRANRLHYRAIMPQSLKRAARVIVTSERTRQAVLRRAPRADVRVIPLGIEREITREIAPAEIYAIRRKYDLPTRFLFYLGNFEPKKNLPNLLRALELLPDAPPLVIAGGIAPWPQFDQLLRGVRQLGFVPRGDVAALMGACEIFCFPSLCEGFGLPVLEALACGAPVVASSAVPLPNLERVALCPPPHQPRAIADAISRWLADDNLRAQMSAAGREYARAFTWERAAHSTLDLYREFDENRFDFERFDPQEPGA